MKIMIVNTYYYPEIVGGAEYSVKKLAEGLHSAGHDVVVLCTGDRDVREKIDGIDVIRFTSKIPTRAINSGSASSLRKIIRRVCDIWNPFNKSKLASIILNEKPDIVHTNGLYDISPIIWKVSKRLDAMVIHTLRDYFLCCPLVAMECEGKKEKCKFQNNLCLVHRKANVRALSKYVDYLTAPSSVTLNKTVKTMGLFTKQTKVIPNAIDFNISEVENILKSKANRHTTIIKFIYLGTLSEKKGVRWLLNAFAAIECNQAELYIAGKGELEQVVEDYVSKDSRIHYVGFLKESDMNKLLMEMDVLLCPSLWEEPFGRVVLDAYKHAIPVIASDRGALPELVIDGVTGKIVHVNHPDELEISINYYINHPNELVKQRYECLKMLKQFDISSQIKAFGDLYANVLYKS